MKSSQQLFREIEALADAALRDDESRLTDYMDEIKHLAFTGGTNEYRERCQAFEDSLKRGE